MAGASQVQYVGCLRGRAMRYPNATQQSNKCTPNLAFHQHNIQNGACDQQRTSTYWYQTRALRKVRRERGELLRRNIVATASRRGRIKEDSAVVGRLGVV